MALVMGLAAVVLGVAAPARAQQDRSVYTVRDVPVRAEAANPAAAKEQALAQGQKEALQILLRRLTLPEDRAYLPDPPPEAVEDLVLGLSIRDEKTPPRGYIATLTVQFLPQAVQQLLQDAGIPFTDQRGRRLVVLPLWRPGPESPPVLWDDPNPWRAAWTERKRQGLVPLDVPIGDLRDISTVNAAQAEEGDTAALEAMARNYDAAGTLIAEATLQPDPENDSAVVTVNATQDGVAGLTYGTQIPVPPDGSLSGALAQAVEAISSQVDDAWKQRTVNVSGVAGRLTALVPLDGLRDWLTVRERLRAAEPVRDWELQAMTRDRAQVTVYFTGTQRQLEEALVRQNLALIDQGSYWVLRPGAPPVDGGLIPGAPGAGGQDRALDDLTRPQGTITVR